MPHALDDGIAAFALLEHLSVTVDDRVLLLGASGRYQPARAVVGRHRSGRGRARRPQAQRHPRPRSGRDGRLQRPRLGRDSTGAPGRLRRSGRRPTSHRAVEARGIVGTAVLVVVAQLATFFDTGNDAAAATTIIGTGAQAASRLRDYAAADADEVVLTLPADDIRRQVNLAVEALTA